MNQIQIEVLEAQVVERLHERRDHVGRIVLVIPKLGGDPELLARNAAGDDRFERRADVVLIAVDPGAVEVAIADFGGTDHGLGDVCAREAVRAESPETDRRHLLAGPQSTLGHSERIDAVLRDGERSWVRLGHAGFSVWPNGWEVKTVALRRDGAVRWNGIAAT